MLTSNTLPDPLIKAYGEVPQANPIRYALYHLDEKENWSAMSAWFKCRDFFNDLVAVYNKQKWTIHGFDFHNVKLNSYGVWVRLKALKAGFVHNVSLLKPQLDEIGVELNVVPFEDDPTQALTLLPRKLFENTFLISKVTLMLRMCNVDKEFDTWEKLCENSTERIYVDAKKEFHKRGLILPEKFQTYWYYSHKNVNSSDKSHYAGVVHDCGFVQWENAMGKA